MSLLLAGTRIVHENPAKHLVYRPTAMQLLSILTTTVETMPKDSVLLLYVSAMAGHNELAKSGAFPSTSCLTSEIAPADSESPVPDNMSDVSVPSASALITHNNATEGIHLGPSKALDPTDSYLVPEDIVHLTRRTLFLVVDSDNSLAFTRLQGQEVGRQCFCLMSPTQRSYELGEANKTGNLMTMFLAGPLMAFCLLTGNTDPSTQQLVDLQVRACSMCGSNATVSGIVVSVCELSVCSAASSLHVGRAADCNVSW